MRRRRRGLVVWSFLPVLLALTVSRLQFFPGVLSYEYDDYDEDDQLMYEEGDDDDEMYGEHAEDYGLEAMEILEDERGLHGIRFEDHNGQDYIVPIPPHMADRPEDEIIQETMLVARTLYQMPIVGHEALLMEAQQYMHPSDRRQRERIILTLMFHSVQGTAHMREQGGWLDDEIHYCDWLGISCGLEERGYADYDFWGDDADSSPPPNDIVTKIEIAGQYLSGTLPTELALLEHLQILDLSNNRIYGTIPTEFSALTELRALDFSYNYLSGTIPEALGVTCKHMEAVAVGSNYLTGQLPRNLDAWTKLWYFDISGNGLTGTISPQIGLMSNMQSLFMADNAFSGQLPEEISLLTWMRLFDAGSNVFTGTLPSGMKALWENLWDFNVADNMLSGTLPLDLMAMANVQLLILSDNLFSGTIPPGDDVVEGRPVEREPVGAKWSTLQRIRTLKLDGNQLTGRLPVEFLEGLKSSVDV